METQQILCRRESPLRAGVAAVTPGIWHYGMRQCETEYGLLQDLYEGKGLRKYLHRGLEDVPRWTWLRLQRTVPDW